MFNLLLRMMIRWYNVVMASTSIWHAEDGFNRPKATRGDAIFRNQLGDMGNSRREISKNSRLATSVTGQLQNIT